MLSRPRKIRSGFTLLELVVSATMLSALAVSCMVLVGTSYNAWNRHEDDHATRHAGHAVLRHITRHARQATSVAAISVATDTSGALSLTDVNGDVYVWDHNAASKEVRFGLNSATEVLATGIEELAFTGIKRNGWETTTTVGQIHSVRCSTKVNVTHPSSTEVVTLSNQAWIRAW